MLGARGAPQPPSTTDVELGSLGGQPSRDCRVVCASATGALSVLGGSALAGVDLIGGDLTTLDIPAYQWNLDLAEGTNPSMLKPDLFHVAGRFMAKQAFQYGSIYQVGGAAGTSAFVGFALPSELNGVAGVFQAGGYFLSPTEVLVTHAAFMVP
jgi:hypothetical protein